MRNVNGRDMNNSSEKSPSASGGARAEYLPEPAYFSDEPGFPKLRAARVTAECTAQWATRYEASPVGHPALLRQGSVPRDPTKREALVGELFAWQENWLSGAGLPDELVGLRLRRGRQTVIDQSDGVPAILFLSLREFAKLQDCLEKAGLPRNLYYPASELRTAVVPVEHLGGVVMARRGYSPLQWVRRMASAGEVPRVPSEQERLKLYWEAISRFAPAAIRRYQELREPGREPDREELDAVYSLIKDVGRNIKILSARIPPPSPDDEPSGRGACR